MTAPDVEAPRPRRQPGGAASSHIVQSHLAIPTPNEVATALGFIPADDREIWVRMGMAVKSALGDAGFDIWRLWSQSSERYCERDARDVWRSVRPDGPVTAASLFAEARAHGYRTAHHGHEAPKTPEGIWQAGTESGASEHPYLREKAVGAHGVRVSGRTLLVPVRALDGKLLSVQAIFHRGGRWEKRFTKNAKLGDGCHIIGTLDSAVIILAEGYATGATLHEAAGYPVAVAFDCGRLASVGRAIRARHPRATILVAGDEDSHLASNPGRSKAARAAEEIHAHAVFPVFQSGGGGDFNDLAVDEGVDAVRKQIDQALSDFRAKADERLADELPEVTLVCGSTIRPAPIDWLWEGWLARGKFHVLAGPPGTGKTTIAAALAATLTSGGRWPDGNRSEAGNALIWSGEDDPTDTLVPRLLASGADLGRIYFVGDVADGDDELTFDPAHHMDALTRAAAKIGGVKLLVVDPIVSAVAGDSHKNAEVRRGLQPLVALAAKLNCAVLGISHFTKGTSGRDPVERVNGSIAFGALARVVFAAAKMPDDDRDGGGRLFCRSKSNIGADSGGFRYDLEQVELDAHPGVFASRLLWGKAEHGSARELLNRAEAVPASQDDDDDALTQVGWLRDFLTYGAKPAEECKAEGRAAGYSEKQVRTAREKLKIKPHRQGYGSAGMWMWSLPEGTFNSDKGAIDARDSLTPKTGASKASLTEAANGAASSAGHERQECGVRASLMEATAGAASSGLVEADFPIGAFDALSVRVQDSRASIDDTFTRDDVEFF